ncbi:hypothetical protein [Kribbella sp. NPDC023855]|uniref:hypothetical protein n=1 Tax=Kribbella sp. NPDC023855 TaxID=3154698 RepID=UPI0034029A3F
MTEQADLHLEIAAVIAEVAASLQAPMELEETLRVIARARPRRSSALWRREYLVHHQGTAGSRRWRRPDRG